MFDPEAIFFNNLWKITSNYSSTTRNQKNQNTRQIYPSKELVTNTNKTKQRLRLHTLRIRDIILTLYHVNFF